MIFDAIDADYIKLRADVKNGSFDSVYARQLKSVMPQLSVDGDLVYLDGSRIVLPLQATKKTLPLMHVAHIGMNKTYDLCRSMYFWPGMLNVIKQMVSQCRPCNVHRPSQPKNPQSQSASFGLFWSSNESCRLGPIRIWRKTAFCLCGPMEWLATEC